MADFKNFTDSVSFFSNVADQISNDGGSIILASGKTDNTGKGFYVAVVGDGTTTVANILNVKLKNSNIFINLPFYEGWNPLLVTEVKNHTGTTFSLYWGY